MSEDITCIRVWAPSKARLDEAVRRHGPNLLRIVDAMVQGWEMLDDSQRQRAIEKSTATTQGTETDGVSRQVWSRTRDALDRLHLETGMNFVRLVDAMTHGWDLLTEAQKRDAIRASAPSRPEPATGRRR